MWFHLFTIVQNHKFVPGPPHWHICLRVAVVCSLQTQLQQALKSYKISHANMSNNCAHGGAFVPPPVRAKLTKKPRRQTANAFLPDCVQFLSDKPSQSYGKTNTSTQVFSIINAPYPCHFQWKYKMTWFGGLTMSSGRLVWPTNISFLFSIS